MSRLGANDPCWCGSGAKFKRCHKATTEPIRPGRQSPKREVPPEIERPPYADTGLAVRKPDAGPKSAEVIDRMRRTSRAAADVLTALGQLLRPGVTTDEIDAACHQLAIERGAYPSPLNYTSSSTPPFPKSLCTSINEVICHGIPDDRPLRDGDIVNLDITLFREGVHGDTNATFAVGTIDTDSARLVRVTRDCLERGIEAVRPGRPFNVIGRAIEDHAHAQGFGVVREFGGHGIGEEFHTRLHIHHYFEPRFTTTIEEGMTFTIEPMITAGNPGVRLWNDGWTAVTVDGRRTAQFEHTLVVTSDGVEILTTPSDTTQHPYWALEVEPAPASLTQ